VGALHSHRHGHGHHHQDEPTDHHDHHDHGDRASDHDRASGALAWALALNFGFLLVEVIIGFWTGSIAVLSDAGHMVADVAALAIALVAQRLSRVRGTDGYTFGLRRLPILGGLANALTLTAIVVLIVVFSLKRFTRPPEIEGWPVLVAGIVGLAVNIGGAWVLWKRGGAGVNARSAMLHLAADALGSIGVIVSGVVLATIGWPLVDPIVSLVIAALIAAGVWPLLRDILRTLLLGSPAKIEVAKVRSVFVEDEKVRCLEDFHLWELDTDYVVLSARVHSDVDSLEASDALVKRISERLKQEFGIHHVTIEVGPHAEGSTHGENDCLSPGIDRPRS
jgi:cobalt-zinc-cadmium efflux system protein